MTGYGLTRVGALVLRDTAFEHSGNEFRSILFALSGAKLKWVYHLAPESALEQEKSRRLGTHMTSGIWQISGTKRAGKRLKSTD